MVSGWFNILITGVLFAISFIIIFIGYFKSKSQSKNYTQKDKREIIIYTLLFLVLLLGAIFLVFKTEKSTVMIGVISILPSVTVYRILRKEQDEE